MGWTVNIFSNILGTCWIFKGRLFIFKFAAIIEILITGPVDCAFHPCSVPQPSCVFEIKNFKPRKSKTPSDKDRWN